MHTHNSLLVSRCIPIKTCTVNLLNSLAFGNLPPFYYMGFIVPIFSRSVVINICINTSPAWRWHLEKCGVKILQWTVRLSTWIKSRNKEIMSVTWKERFNTATYVFIMSERHGFYISSKSRFFSCFVLPAFNCAKNSQNEYSKSQALYKTTFFFLNNDSLFRIKEQGCHIYSQTALNSGF